MDGRLRPTNMIFLSGWLFADLLLGLSLIFLASSEVPTPVRADAAATPTIVPTMVAALPTAVPTLTPVPTSTPVPCVVEIQQERRRFEREKTIGRGWGQNPTADELQQALSELRGERVFLVMTFSHIPFDQKWPQGQRDAAERVAKERATQVNETLFAALPHMFVRGKTLTDVGKHENSALEDEAKVDLWVWLRKDKCSDDANR
jgi:hypothetical protein